MHVWLLRVSIFAECHTGGNLRTVYEGDSSTMYANSGHKLAQSLERSLVQGIHSILDARWLFVVAVYRTFSPISCILHTYLCERLVHLM